MRILSICHILCSPPAIFKLANLSTAEGYPMAFLSTWAFTSRCGLILLIAISLRPAPSPVQPQGLLRSQETSRNYDFIEGSDNSTEVEEHHLERETREQFLGCVLNDLQYVKMQ